MKSLSLNSFWQKFLRYWNRSNHSALALLVLSIGLILVVVNLSSKLTTLRKNVLEEKAKIEKLEIIERDYEVAEAAVTSIDVYGHVFKNFIPHRDAVLEKIKILEQVAQQTGNDQSIVIKEPPPDPKARKKRPDFVNSDTKVPKEFSGVDFTINLTGNYISLISYLERLESQPVLLDFERMSVKSVQQNSQQGFVNTGQIITTIEGTIFYRK